MQALQAAKAGIIHHCLMTLETAYLFIHLLQCEVSSITCPILAGLMEASFLQLTQWQQAPHKMDVKVVEEEICSMFQSCPIPTLALNYLYLSLFCSYQVINREARKLTCREALVVVNNRVQEVGLPGMLCLSHSSVVVEDILVIS